MGNCMEASNKRQMKEEEEEEEIKKENSTGKSRVKVKVVLTKEELELFMVKLKKNHGGGKRFGDLLEEIKKARCGNKHHSWRPSLESIKED
ncbi:hypothetical protein ERO13_A02G100200v2 [Gossypium hirsutum]|uniref:Uncharacterized protein n=2 Tax=Gossypium TaxID=3633 RepID=A0ABM2ZGL0_GOSHI|nr:uncharacterized protein LOC121212665 [Gossypium hirsutum]KAG4211376.1 hypothetical protein ERO13_A02G100200v2 [Gossypium hirsutum]TYI39826.1 hypothetical protein ES332_A02G121300v1 [Gossypium tomentosum]